jgi:hypothetical protein
MHVSNENLTEVYVLHPEFMVLAVCKVASHNSINDNIVRACRISEMGRTQIVAINNERITGFFAKLGRIRRWIF